MAEIATASPIMPPGSQRLPVRITVDEYERILEAGALNDPDAVELVDGYMVDKMGKSAEHGFAAKKVIRALEGVLARGWAWRLEQPLRVPDYDEPEPDVTIVRGTDDDYEHRIPGPADVGLVIEVSLTTHDQDRGKKRVAYASAAIPVYWIIDLINFNVEVYSDPRSGKYQSALKYGRGDAVPVVIDGQQLGAIAVDSFMPSAPIRPTAQDN